MLVLVLVLQSLGRVARHCVVITLFTGNAFSALDRSVVSIVTYPYGTAMVLDGPPFALYQSLFLSRCASVVNKMNEN